jgi:hypothetical protein
MAAVKGQAARDLQTSVQNFRTQLGQFEWGGMIPDGDAGSLPPHRPRLLINTRRMGGSIVPRSGQKLFLDLGDVGAINGLFDFQLGTKKSLAIVGIGCPGLSAGTGYSMGTYDIDQFPKAQPFIYYSTATISVFVATYGDDLYITSDKLLRKFQPTEAPYGQNGLAVSGSSQDISLYSAEAPFTSISALRQFSKAGLLFMCVDGGAGASKVKTWDGLTIRDDLTAVDTLTGFGEYRELLIAGFKAATNKIKTRDLGGNWTTYSPNAGTCTFLAGVSFQDKFYWTTGGQDLFSFDGTNVVQLPFATTGIPVGSTTYGIAVMGGFLYISYTTAGGHGKIASFDGTTWLPAIVDLTVTFPNMTAARPLAFYRNQLWLGGTETGGGNPGGNLYSSPDGVAWSRVPYSGSPTQSGAIYELVPY